MCRRCFRPEAAATLETWQQKSQRASIDGPNAKGSEPLNRRCQTSALAQQGYKFHQTFFKPLVAASRLHNAPEYSGKPSTGNGSMACPFATPSPMFAAIVV
jgi:hypothetical protein